MLLRKITRKTLRIDFLLTDIPLAVCHHQGEVQHVYSIPVSVS